MNFILYPPPLPPLPPLDRHDRRAVALARRVAAARWHAASRHEDECWRHYIASECERRSAARLRRAQAELLRRSEELTAALRR
jgi:hypothetical protein